MATPVPNGTFTLVGSVMKENVLTIQAEQKLSLAAQMMLWGGLHHLPVKRDERLVGMLSEHDILRAQRDGGLDRPVAEVMKRPVLTSRPDESVEEAASRMLNEHVGCLPIVEDDQVVGIVTASDLLSYLARPAELAEGRVQPEARDVMSTMALAFEGSDDVLEVVATMVRERVRHLPIVDSERRVIGIVSDRDLRAAVGDPVQALRERDDTRDEERWPVSEIMTSAPTTVRADTPLEEVARCFVDESVGAVPVVDSEMRLIGIVSYVDLLRFAYRDGFS